MGKRFLSLVAFVFLGFTFLNSTGNREPELYVSAFAPLSYRAAAELPSAVLMTEMSAEEMAKQAWLAKFDAPTWGRHADLVPSRNIAAASALGTEVPATYGQPDSSYDWRLNEKDWRFQLLCCIPFGFLFIAISLQSSRRAELRGEEEDECEISAMGGMVPSEKCRQMAMA
jgi:hypothetical protein